MIGSHNQWCRVMSIHWIYHLTGERSFPSLPPRLDSSLCVHGTNEFYICTLETPVMCTSPSCYTSDIVRWPTSYKCVVAQCKQQRHQYGRHDRSVWTLLCVDLVRLLLWNSRGSLSPQRPPRCCARWRLSLRSWHLALGVIMAVFSEYRTQAYRYYLSVGVTYMFSWRWGCVCTFGDQMKQDSMAMMNLASLITSMRMKMRSARGSVNHIMDPNCS